MRLDKYLKDCGLGTRKEVKQLIRKKQIRVNENIVRDESMHVDETKDVVYVNDEALSYQKLVYIMMNKPKDVVSATYDHYQTCVIDLIEGFEHRDLFPIGRLDIDTTGLLVLSDDGKTAHALLSPKKHVEKEYEAVLKFPYEESYQAAFEKGIVLEDGYVCMPGKILPTNQAYTVRIIIKEGKFHQVKRMMQSLNNEVVELKRIRMNQLLLDEALAVGEYRLLSDEEICLLKGEVYE